MDYEIFKIVVTDKNSEIKDSLQVTASVDKAKNLMDHITEALEDAGYVECDICHAYFACELTDLQAALFSVNTVCQSCKSELPKKETKDGLQNK
jgi:hypothetical protein